MRELAIPLSWRLGLVLSVLLNAAAASAADVPSRPCDPAALPQYADFAVAPETISRPAPLKRNSAFARKYRTRLGEGLRNLSVNFAGHYVMITWSCGSTCLDGGMVDARNGEAAALPFLLDSFGGSEIDIADPLLFRTDSRLVIMLGMLREEDQMPREIFLRMGGRQTCADLPCSHREGNQMKYWALPVHQRSEKMTWNDGVCPTGNSA